MTNTQISVDSIVENEDKTVSFRIVTTVTDDDEVVSVAYHRQTVAPGDDLVDVPAEVAKLCKSKWTPAVVESFKSAVVRS